MTKHTIESLMELVSEYGCEECADGRHDCEDSSTDKARAALQSALTEVLAERDQLREVWMEDGVRTALHLI